MQGQIYPILVNMQNIKYLLLGMAVIFAAFGCRCSGSGEDDAAEEAVSSASLRDPFRANAPETASPAAALPVVFPANAPETVSPEAPKRPWTAYEGKVEVDKTSHDFGDMLVSDGPVKCAFIIKNISSEALSISQVVSSCGCTDVEWTREEIAPGKSGKISATYKNDAGAVPFDKTLTVYVSVLKKPIVLHLRGTVHEKAKSLEELYGAVRRGPLGLKSDMLRAGNLEQGTSKTGSVLVANLGKKSAKVDFIDISPQLHVTIDPNPVPAASTSTLYFTVDADRSLWGTNVYTAIPVIDGKPCEIIRVTAVTKENFTALTQEQKDNAPLPMLAESTFDAGMIKQGATVRASFKMSNKGKSALKVYKAEADTPGVSIGDIPEIAPGGSFNIDAGIDTSAFGKGEFTVMLTLYTNSPSRPLVNLFIVGIVE